MYVVLYALAYVDSVCRSEHTTWKHVSMGVQRVSQDWQMTSVLLIFGPGHLEITDSVLLLAGWHVYMHRLVKHCLACMPIYGDGHISIQRLIGSSCSHIYHKVKS